MSSGVKMAKKKNSAVLFDVITQQIPQQDRGREMAVPQWIRPRKNEDEPCESPDVDGSESPEADNSESLPDELSLPTPTWPDEPSEAAGDAPDSSAQADMPQRAVSPADGRLNLSLSRTACVAAGAVLILLLGGAFMLGRGSAPATTVGSGVTQKASLSGQGDGSSRNDAGRQAGVTSAHQVKFYLVIERLGSLSERAKSSADKIAADCTDMGYDAKVDSNKNEYFVYLTRPVFDSKKDRLAYQTAENIHRLGKQYKKSHPGTSYEFNQYKQGRLKPVFVSKRK